MLAKATQSEGRKKEDNLGGQGCVGGCGGGGEAGLTGKEKIGQGRNAWLGAKHEGCCILTYSRL